MLDSRFLLDLKKGNLVPVALRLRLGADVNGTDENGRTPLMIAASAGHTDICRLLLNHGADKDICSPEGKNARSYASSPEIISLLSSHTPKGNTGSSRERLLLSKNSVSTVSQDSAFEDLQLAESSKENSFWSIEEEDFSDEGLSGWEAEPEPQSIAPQNDQILHDAAGRDETLGDIKPDLGYADWGEADIELPEGKKRRDIPALVDRRNRALWDMLVLLAVNRSLWMDGIGTEDSLPDGKSDMDSKGNSIPDAESDTDSEEEDLELLPQARRTLISAIAEFPCEKDYELDFWLKFSSVPGVNAEAVAELALEICRRLGKGDSEEWLQYLHEKHEIYWNSVYEIACAYLHLLKKPAPNCSGRGCDDEDLCQEGFFGLLKGCARFEVAEAAQLQAYVSIWIWQVESRYIANNFNTIRIPVHKLESCRGEKDNALHSWEEHDDMGLGFVEFPFWLDRNALDASDGRVPPVIRYRLDCMNLHDKGRFLAVNEPSPIDTYEAAERLNLAELVRREVSGLKAKQKYVISRRFGLDDGVTRTLEEVGQEMDVTREWIRQIEAKALPILEGRLRNKGICNE